MSMLLWGMQNFCKRTQSFSWGTQNFCERRQSFSWEMQDFVRESEGFAHKCKVSRENGKLL